MSDESKRHTRRQADWRRRQGKAESALVLFMLALWGMAFTQLVRSWFWGVVWLPQGRYSFSSGSHDRFLSIDAVDFWFAVAMWSWLGPGTMLGVGVFLWIGRNDPV